MNVKPITSESARAAANSGRQNISREFHDLVADIEDLVKQTASLSGEELNLARTRLAELIASAKTSAEDMGGAVAQRARRSAAATNNYVHEQPWKAIGIGATVGLLLGVVLARR